jgi:RimJ/RimL family protein N-acetyltransferase
MSLTFPQQLVTPRLVLRAVAQADLPDLLAINGDPEVTRYLPYEAWKDLTAARAWLERMRKIESEGTALQLVVARADDARVIGTCLLFRLDEGSARAELGYVMKRDHWRGGWMREALEALLAHAFTAMEIRRIEADVDPANIASQRLLERLGFEREGVRRERWVQKGRAVDSMMFGVLAREWLAARASQRARSESSAGARSETAQ